MSLIHRISHRVEQLLHLDRITTVFRPNSPPAGPWVRHHAGTGEASGNIVPADVVQSRQDQAPSANPRVFVREPNGPLPHTPEYAVVMRRGGRALEPGGQRRPAPLTPEDALRLKQFREAKQRAEDRLVPRSPDAAARLQNYEAVRNEAYAKIRDAQGMVRRLPDDPRAAHFAKRLERKAVDKNDILEARGMPVVRSTVVRSKDAGAALLPSRNDRHAIVHDHDRKAESLARANRESLFTGQPLTSTEHEEIDSMLSIGPFSPSLHEQVEHALHDAWKVTVANTPKGLAVPERPVLPFKPGKA